MITVSSDKGQSPIRVYARPIIKVKLKITIKQCVSIGKNRHMMITVPSDEPKCMSMITIIILIIILIRIKALAGQLYLFVSQGISRSK